MDKKQELTPRQLELYEQLKGGLDEKLKELDKLLDVQKIGELWGERELRLRALLLEMGQQAVETVAEDRKKGVPGC